MQADNHGYKYKCYIALNSETHHIQFTNPIEKSQVYAMSSWSCIQLFDNLWKYKAEKLYPLTEISDEFLKNLDYSDDASSRLKEQISRIIEDEQAADFLAGILTDTCFTFTTEEIAASETHAHLLSVCYFANELLELLSSGSFDDLRKQIQTFFNPAFINFCRYYPYIDYSNDSLTFIDLVVPTNLHTLVGLCVVDIQRRNMLIRRCKNCGDFFVPASRSDEVYCDTCKKVSYDEKIKSDAILKEYRKVYKTQNARKQRNSHVSNISERFQAWVSYAKTRLSECQNGLISIEQLISDISSDEWMHKEAANGEHSQG